MLRRNLTGQRLLALFMLGWLLFNFPLLALFDGATDWLGLPGLWMYLFVAWTLLIAGMAWVAERGRDGESHTVRPGKAHGATASLPDTGE